MHILCCLLMTQLKSMLTWDDVLGLIHALRYLSSQFEQQQYTFMRLLVERQRVYLYVVKARIVMRAIIHA